MANEGSVVTSRKEPAKPHKLQNHCDCPNFITIESARARKISICSLLSSSFSAARLARNWMQFILVLYFSPLSESFFSSFSFFHRARSSLLFLSHFMSSSYTVGARTLEPTLFISLPLQSTDILIFLRIEFMIDFKVCRNEWTLLHHHQLLYGTASKAGMENAFSGLLGALLPGFLFALSRDARPLGARALNCRH